MKKFALKDRRQYVQEEEVKFRNRQEFITNLEKALTKLGYRVSINVHGISNMDLFIKSMYIVNSVDKSWVDDPENEENMFPESQLSNKKPFSGQDLFNLIAICQEAIRRKNEGRMDDLKLQCIFIQFKIFTGLVDIQGRSFFEFLYDLIPVQNEIPKQGE